MKMTKSYIFRMIILILTMGLMTNSIANAYDAKPDLYVNIKLSYFLPIHIIIWIIWAILWSINYNISDTKEDFQTDTSKMALSANQIATKISLANHRPSWKHPFWISSKIYNELKFQFCSLTYFKLNIGKTESIES